MLDIELLKKCDIALQIKPTNPLSHFHKNQKTPHPSCVTYVWMGPYLGVMVAMVQDKMALIHKTFYATQTTKLSLFVLMISKKKFFQRRLYRQEQISLWANIWVSYCPSKWLTPKQATI